MKYTTIEVIRAEGLTHIQFNRPESLNAFNPVMMSELKDAFTKVSTDEECKVVLISGKGRAFSAGVDLKTTKAEDFLKESPFMKMGHEVGELMRQIPQVTIAQVHGYCFTGALEMMMFFDMAFCDDNTQFGDTHAKWGIMPRWGMTQRLARRVGLAKAKELTFRAYRVKGPEAERIGLVNRSFEKGKLGEQVQAIVGEILENSHEAIVKIKQLYDDGYHTTLGEGLEIERHADIRIGDTSDQLSQFETKKFKG